MRTFLSKTLVFSFFLFSILYFLSSATLTYAVSQITPTQSNTTVPPSNTNLDVPNNLHNWTQNVMIEVMLSLTCQLVGVDPTQPNGQCLGVDPTTGKIGFLPSGNLAKGEIGGAIGGMNNMISMLYTPPIHTGDYFQNLAQNFIITKEAYAQRTGTGFDGLKPLLSLWTAFRNIVYLLFVIVFIVIGLAIMLRVKIDPRTVMTIQNQIPKIIIGILLVTFSFAIAGFLVDLMWIFIYLTFGLISGVSQDVAQSVNQLSPTLLQGKSPLGIDFGGLSGMVDKVAGGSKETIQGLLGINPKPTTYIPLWNPLSGIANFFTDTANNVSGWFNLGPVFPADATGARTTVNALIDTVSTVLGFIIGYRALGWDFPSGGFSFAGFGAQVDLGFLGNVPVATAIGGIIYDLVQVFMREALPYLIIFIIIFIALFTALFRLWFVLLMAYVNILTDVVLAPFWIVGSLVPGSPISVTGWLRDLTANLAAFPVTIAMFLLGKVFMDSFGKTPAPGTQNFVPPLIGNPGDTSAIGALIGLGIILMTPNVVNMLKTALKAPKIDTGGVGKAIGISTGVLQAPFKPLITGATFIGGQKFAKKFIPGLGDKPERPPAAA